MHHISTFSLENPTPIFLSFEILAGECRLENMRTLCVACHADVTATQRTERRLTRIVAKKKLKAVMSNLKTINKPKQKMDEPEVCTFLDFAG